MTAQHDPEEELQAYVDGELPEARDYARINEQLMRDPRAEASLRELRTATRAYHEFFEALSRGPVSAPPPAAPVPAMPAPPLAAAPPPVAPPPVASPPAASPYSAIPPSAVPAPDHGPSAPPPSLLGAPPAQNRAWGFFGTSTTLTPASGVPASGAPAPAPSGLASSDDSANPWGRLRAPSPIAAPPRAQPAPPPATRADSEMTQVVSGPSAHPSDQEFTQSLSPSGIDEARARLDAPTRADTEMATDVEEIPISRDREVEITDLAELVGLEVSGYFIEAEIASGGMGTVFRALQVSMDRPVALKVLAPRLQQDEIFVKRFEREARAAAQLDHPNLVRIYEVGEAHGCSFYSMELIEGPDLKAVLADGALPPKRALDLAIQACSAMELAASHGIVHRDIKPANMLIQEGTGALKIADLGLAKEIKAQAETMLTVDRQVMGSPNYMSPEQAEDVRKADHQSDVYAIGATLYHMLTGEPPYGKGQPVEIIARMLTEPLTFPVPKGQPPLDDGLIALVRKAMAKPRAERFASAAELRAELEDILSNPARKPAFARSSADGLGRSGVTRSRPSRSSAPTGPSKGLLAAAALIGFFGVGLAPSLLSPSETPEPIARVDEPAPRPPKETASPPPPIPTEVAAPAASAEAEEAERQRRERLAEIAAVIGPQRKADARTPTEAEYLSMLSELGDMAKEAMTTAVRDDASRLNAYEAALLEQRDELLALKPLAVEGPSADEALTDIDAFARRASYVPKQDELATLKRDIIREIRARYEARYASIIALAEKGAIAEARREASAEYTQIAARNDPADIGPKFYGLPAEIDRIEAAAKARAAAEAELQELPLILAESGAALHFAGYAEFNARLDALRAREAEASARLKEQLAPHIEVTRHALAVLVAYGQALIDGEGPRDLRMEPGLGDAPVTILRPADPGCKVNLDPVTGKATFDGDNTTDAGILFKVTGGNYAQLRPNAVETSRILLGCEVAQHERACFLLTRGDFVGAREAAERYRRDLAAGQRDLLASFDAQLEGMRPGIAQSYFRRLVEAVGDKPSRLRRGFEKVWFERLTTELNAFLSEDQRAQLAAWGAEAFAAAEVSAEVKGYAYRDIEVVRELKDERERYNAKEVLENQAGYMTLRFDFSSASNTRSWEARDYEPETRFKVHEVPAPPPEVVRLKPFQQEGDGIWTQGMGRYRLRREVKTGFFRMELEASAHSDSNLSLYVGERRGELQGLKFDCDALEMSPALAAPPLAVAVKSSPMFGFFVESYERLQPLKLRLFRRTEQATYDIVHEATPVALRGRFRLSMEVYPTEGFLKHYGEVASEALKTELKDWKYVALLWHKRAEDKAFRLISDPVPVTGFEEGECGLRSFGGVFLVHEVKVTALFKSR